LKKVVVKIEEEYKYSLIPKILDQNPKPEFVEHEFDRQGYKISFSIKSKPPFQAFKTSEIRFVNVYEKVEGKTRIKERERIVELPYCWNGYKKKKFYEYSGLGTKVTELDYDGENEEVFGYQTDWIYHWLDNRLLSKKQTFGIQGEEFWEYQYYDCWDMPWHKKPKSIIRTRSDYDKFFKLTNTKSSEELHNYDNKGNLKEEIFVSHSGRMDFINVYDARGDCVEVRAYYSTGVLASREEHKHFYKNINGVELRVRTETKMFRVEFKEREDGWYDKIETPTKIETATYEYEFYK
jgi:hypothetical protein